MKTRSLVWGALSVAILTLGAYIRIPTPVAPLTFSVQMLLLCALVSDGIRVPFAAVSVYLLMGFMGLPVFSSGGGISTFLLPTAGFLIGYLPFVMLTSKFRNKGEYTGALYGLSALYAVGITYFVLISEFYLGAYPLPLSGVILLFGTMFIKDVIFVFPVVQLARRIKKAKRER